MPLGINEVGRNVSKYELSFQITFCVPMCPSRWGQVKTESCAHIITSIDSLIIQSWHVTKLYLKITMIAWGRCRNNVKDQQGGWETLRHQALNRPRQAAPISIPPLLSHGSDGSCGTGASRSPWSASCSARFMRRGVVMYIRGRYPRLYGCDGFKSQVIDYLLLFSQAFCSTRI
jgi:hypothetical protein